MSNPNDRIIDRDVAFYEAEMERCSIELRRCPPEKEAHWTMMLLLAGQVCGALKSYRQGLDLSTIRSTSS